MSEHTVKKYTLLDGFLRAKFHTNPLAGLAAGPLRVTCRFIEQQDVSAAPGERALS